MIPLFLNNWALVDMSPFCKREISYVFLYAKWEQILSVAANHFFFFFSKRRQTNFERVVSLNGVSSIHYENTYSNILKILPPKNENFQMKNYYIFHISAHNIDCGYSLEPPQRGGSNEYP